MRFNYKKAYLYSGLLISGVVLFTAGCGGGGGSGGGAGTKSIERHTIDVPNKVGAVYGSFTPVEVNVSQPALAISNYAQGSYSISFDEQLSENYELLNGCQDIAFGQNCILLLTPKKADLVGSQTTTVKIDIGSQSIYKVLTIENGKLLSFPQEDSLILEKGQEKKISLVNNTNVPIYIGNVLVEQTTSSNENTNNKRSGLNVKENNCGEMLEANQSCSFILSVDSTVDNANYEIKLGDHQSVKKQISTSDLPASLDLINALPEIVYQNEAYPVDFIIRNLSTDTVMTGVEVSAVFPSDYTVTKNTCNVTSIAAKSQCQINGIYTPKKANGKDVLSVTLVYREGAKAQISTATQIESFTLQGEIIQGLSKNVHKGSKTPIEFKFENPAINTGVANNLSFVGNYPSGFQETTNECAKLTELKPGDDCYVVGVFSADVNDSMASISATLVYNKGQSVSETTNGYVSDFKVDSSISDLPYILTKGKQYPLTITFYNNSNRLVLESFSVQGSSDPGFKETVNNCLPLDALAAGQSCSIIGRIDAQSEGEISVQYKMMAKGIEDKVVTVNRKIQSLVITGTKELVFPVTMDKQQQAQFRHKFEGSICVSGS